MPISGDRIWIITNTHRVNSWGSQNSLPNYDVKYGAMRLLLESPGFSRSSTTPKENSGVFAKIAVEVCQYESVSLGKRPTQRS